MAKSIFHVPQMVVKALGKSGIRNLISGGIYQENRPPQSQKSDIVVKSVSFQQDGPILLTGIEIRVYVPDVRFSTGEEVIVSHNYAKLEEVASKIVALIREHDFPDTSAVATGCSLLETSEEHFMKINADFCVHDF